MYAFKCNKPSKIFNIIIITYVLWLTAIIIKIDGGYLENDQKSVNFAKKMVGPISNINQYIKLYLYVKFDAFCSKRTIRIIYYTKRLDYLGNMHY